MVKATFWGQFKAVMWKNMLLKKRNKKQSIQEFLWPIYFVAILAVVKHFIKPNPVDRIGNFPETPVFKAGFLQQAEYRLLVAPDTADVRGIVADVTDLLLSLANSTATVSVEYFNNQTAAEAAYANNNSLVLAGILFDTNNNLSYSIRFPFDSTPDSSLSNLYTNQKNCRDKKENHDQPKENQCLVQDYIDEGFSALQLAIDTALMRRELGDPKWDPPELKTQLLPKPVYQPDTSYIQIISSIYFVIAYSPFINFLTVNIVAEKEKKIKEGMKMMGLSNSVFWLSWTTIYFVIIVLVTGVVVIIAVAAKFFEHSNIFLFFVLLVLYGLSIIAISFAMTPFFNKAQVAGGLASMGTIIVSLLYLAVSMTRDYGDGDGSVSYSIPVWGRWLLCLASPVAVALGLDQATYLDIRGGMNFETASKGEFPLYVPILMLLFDVVLYFFLAFYFDNVIPGDYGPRHKPWFLFTKSFWCPASARNNTRLSTQQLMNNGDSLSYGTGSNTAINANSQGDIEMLPASMSDRIAVRISNLTKTFPGKGDKKVVRAVDELSLSIYEGQITAILGHNGAGKTTLMNILTGLTGPTSGHATIMGLDVANTRDIQRIRQMTGVCPQHNILFDDLTCTEHLQVFAGIKGVPNADMQKEVKAAMDSVGLGDQGGVLASKLSGGQKRKLCVAIAIIGDPKIIFLDEPTAGMDPYSRRHLWSVLKEKKKGRIILLTTHFMDEADILADRKAIVSKGSLRCCGSSLFLKSRFGLGYHLNMVVEPDCDTTKVGDLVSGIVTGSEVNRVHGKELDVTMPQSGVSEFAALFTELERKVTGQSVAEKVGIKSYGVSMTTLEEVFLKLEEAEEAAEIDDTGKIGRPSNDKDLLITKTATNSRDVNIDMMTDDPTSSVNCVTGRDLAIQRFWALCKIRALGHWRSKAAMIFQVFLPVALVIAGLVLSKTNTQSQTKQNEAAKSPSPLLITPAYYTNLTFMPQQFPYGVPRLLMRDIANNTGSASVVSNMQALYYIDDSYDGSFYNNDSFKLLAVSPHYLGIAINRFDVTGQSINSSYTAMYNDSAVHSIPATINVISNAIFYAAKILAGQAPDNSSISLSSLPWPQLELKKTFNNAAFSSVLIIAMAFAVIPGGFGVEIVRDRQEKVRSQLRVSGVPFSIYWGSAFAVHFVKNFIPVFLAIIVVFAVQVDSLMPAGAVVSFLLVCVAYVPANIMFSYLMSFMFDKWETCQAAQPLIFFLIGYLPYLPVSLVDMLGTESAARAIHYACCFLDPPYVIFGGIYYIDKVYRTAEIYETKTTDFGEYFNFSNNIVFCYLMSIVHVVLIFFLLRVLDIIKTGGEVRDACGMSRSRRRAQISPLISHAGMDREDEDVAQERTRVNDIKTTAATNGGPVAYVDSLWKEFTKEGLSMATRIVCLCICPFLILTKKFRELNVTKHVAVRNVAFAVDAGEVFGLLGPNGAGKTTTLSMMTADIGPDSGEVVVGGHDVRSSLSDAFQAMGYCPQHDALWETITLQEHLECYAMVRGIPRAEVSRITSYFLENLKLDEHASKPSKELSGGTKRKLSYCMSMMGRPKIVLLDEPSTGMDPQSKRFLWDTISSSFENSERGAILTTHYMEEADALCSRIAIMINGKVECLGSSTHLKNKYGSGYLLEVKLLTLEGEEEAALLARMDRLHEYVVRLFPQATVLEQFSERVQYKVPKSNVTALSRAFTVLEEGKMNHNIEEYSFSQSTLEQVFLEFAKRQLEDGQDEKEQEDERKKAYARSVSVRSAHSDTTPDTSPRHLNDLAAVRL